MLGSQLTPPPPPQFLFTINNGRETYISGNIRCVTHIFNPLLSKNIPKSYIWKVFRTLCAVHIKRLLISLTPQAPQLSPSLSLLHPSLSHSSLLSHSPVTPPTPPLFTVTDRPILASNANKQLHQMQTNMQRTCTVLKKKDPAWNFTAIQHTRRTIHLL